MGSGRRPKTRPLARRSTARVKSWRLITYGPAFSGQSSRLITGRSLVRIQVGPPDRRRKRRSSSDVEQGTHKPLAAGSIPASATGLAEVVKLVDTQSSGRCEPLLVRVRIPPSAPRQTHTVRPGGPAPPDVGLNSSRSEGRQVAPDEGFPAKPTTHRSRRASPPSAAPSQPDTRATGRLLSLPQLRMPIR